MHTPCSVQSDSTDENYYRPLHTYHAFASAECNERSVDGRYMAPVVTVRGLENRLVMCDVATGVIELDTRIGTVHRLGLSHLQMILLTKCMDFEKCMLWLRGISIRCTALVSLVACLQQVIRDVLAISSDLTGVSCMILQIWEEKRARKWYCAQKR